MSAPTLPQQQQSWTDLFKIPDTLKQLFDKYPLITYPANELPASAPTQNLRRENVLYIFASPEIVASGGPSFNPGCLKWQAYLKFHSITFRTVASNNHASPSGALPFLQPLSSKSSAALHTSPITSNKLAAWAYTHSPSSSCSSSSATADNDAEAFESAESAYLAPYHSLLSQHIRLAYLHALYLHTPTFDTLARPLYMEPCTSNALVRHALSYPLRGAALEQILVAAGPVAPAVSGSNGKVDIDTLEERADEALDALSALLGDADWFSSCISERDQAPVRGGGGGRDTAAVAASQGMPDNSNTQEAKPGLLDAAVFAYTHVILTYFVGEADDSPAQRMLCMIRQRDNLVRHCDRIRQRYFTSPSHCSSS